MECKKCKAQLDKGVTICPECGTDNAAAQPQGIVLTPAKLVALVAGVVLLTALVVGLIMTGMGYSFAKPVETEPLETVEPSVGETAAAPTVPADGNPDDVTCKGSYTVSDDEVIANMSTVVATVGDRQLTNAQLQIYYWLEVQNFLAQYGSYAAYFGLDYTQPLDTQICGLTEDGQTWQQYFLAAALADWHNYAALAEEAEVNEFVLEEQYVTMIQSLPETLATDAGLQGFESAEEYLAYNVGKGASIAEYQAYMTTYYEGFMYFQSRYEAMVPTQEEMEAYFTEHEEEYAASGITKDGKTVDVRHILVLPEGATVDTIHTETFSEEAWAVGEKNANDILNQWLSGEKTEETFAALANEHSADTGSNTNGGLYTDVATGDMVEAFDAWCFDPNRKVGDYAIVKTELGYHIMFMSAIHPSWYVNIRHILVLPEGATVETIYTETFSEEAWAVGEKNANDILNQWLSGEKTEEAFAALANEHSADPGSNTNGGLYTDVATGEMVEAFDAWCFDLNRKAGDYGIVKTELGYHIMYMSSICPIWQTYVESDLLSERGTALINAATEKYPLTVEYSKISIGYVNMAA